MATSKLYPAVTKVVIEKPATLELSLSLEEAVALYIVTGGIGGTGSLRKAIDKIYAAIQSNLQVSGYPCFDRYLKTKECPFIESSSDSKFIDTVDNSSWR